MIVWQKGIELVKEIYVLTKSYIQFVRISRGSLYEIETMMVIAQNQNYFNEEQKSSTSSRIDELGKMLNKLLQKLDSYIDKN